MKTRIIGLLLSLTLLLPTGPVLGWGEEGHRIVMRIAADLMPPGERSLLLSEENESRLDYFLLLPDNHNAFESYGKTEGPNHYLNIEKLGRFEDFDGFRAALPRQSLAVGRLVARIEDCSLSLRNAASRGNRGEWLRWAGFLAHYVGDAHQPLHTTSNHDGKETSNVFDLKDADGSSVHHRYESGLVNHYSQELEAHARDLATRFLGTNGGLTAEAQRFHFDPPAYVASFVWGAHGHVQEIVDADNQITGRRPRFNMKKGRYYPKMYRALGELTAQQLARAAIAVAAMWYDSYNDTPLESEPDTVRDELSTVVHRQDAVMPW